MFQTHDLDIRPETPYQEKSRNPISNQLNVERLTWKKNINYIKGSKTKKTTIKRMKIKIEIQNKFYFL